MLLIDGVWYQLWEPQKELEEFQPIVKEHYKEIFGEKSLILEANRLKSGSGMGSIPDAFVIDPGILPQWHIVEIELSTHQVYDHIVNQVGRFINGIGDSTTQRKIIDAMYHELTETKIRKAEVEDAIGSGEIYKFLSDLISKPPILTIIIEKKTRELQEAINIIKYSPIKIIEFQTLIREGVGLPVHAHLFEPLYRLPSEKEEQPKPGGEVIIGERQKRVTVKNLIDTKYLQVGQIIYRSYKGQRFEGRILSDGSIELAPEGIKFNSLSAAATGVTNTSEDGWTKWYTRRENGVECLMDEFRKEYLSKHSS